MKALKLAVLYTCMLFRFSDAIKQWGVVSEEPMYGKERVVFQVDFNLQNFIKVEPEAHFSNVVTRSSRDDTRLSPDAHHRLPCFPFVSSCVFPTGLKVDLASRILLTLHPDTTCFLFECIRQW